MNENDKEKNNINTKATDNIEKGSSVEKELSGGMLREEKIEKTNKTINSKYRKTSKKHIKNPTLRFLYNLLFKDTALKIISIFVAFLIWLCVAYFVSPNINKLIGDVAVDINISDTATGKLGLSIISTEKDKVSVLVRGERANIGSLNSDSIKISAVLTDITEPGIYTVKLEAIPQGANTNFEIMSVAPEYIKIRFDSIVKKTIPVVVDNTGVEIMEGLVGTEPEPSISEMTIKGPASDINKISYISVPVSTETPLLNSTQITGKVILKDENGTDVNGDYITLEKSEIPVLIPVYKIKEIPLAIEFLNLPSSISSSEIPYSLDHSTIQVAGPPDKIDAMKEIKIGDVNMNEVTLDYKKDFNLQLPTGYISLDNIEKINFTFNSEKFSSKTISVKKFNILNVPQGKTATVISKVVYNVNIIGEVNALNLISADDAYGEIDLADKSVENGQWNFTAMVKIPDKGLVWSTGKYQVTVKIS